MGQLTKPEKHELEGRKELATALTVDLEKMTLEGSTDAHRWTREAQYALLYRMRTNIDPHFTLDDQASYLGVSVATVKRWANSDEYAALASELTVPTRSDIIQAAHDYMQADLLPMALQRLKGMLVDSDTKSTALLGAIKTVMDRTLPSSTPDYGNEQRRDVMEFLKNRGVAINTLNIIHNAPTALGERLQEIVPGDWEEKREA